MSRQQAISYVAAYASAADVRAVLPAADAEVGFRLGVQNIDFEYRPGDRNLIARGYVFQNEKAGPRDDVLRVLQDIQQRPDSALVATVLGPADADWRGYRFDADFSYREVQPGVVYRLNLRQDFLVADLSEREFVGQVRALAMAAYAWDKRHYERVLDYCNDRLFHERSESIFRRYAADHQQAAVLQQTPQGFEAKAASLSFNYQGRKQLLKISFPLRNVRGPAKDVEFYRRQAAQDPAWFRKAGFVVEGERVVVSIDFFEFAWPDAEVVRVIDHCVEAANNWQAQWERTAP